MRVELGRTTEAFPRTTGVLRAGPFSLPDTPLFRHPTGTRFSGTSRILDGGKPDRADIVKAAALGARCASRNNPSTPTRPGRLPDDMGCRTQAFVVLTVFSCPREHADRVGGRSPGVNPTTLHHATALACQIERDASPGLAQPNEAQRYQFGTTAFPPHHQRIVNCSAGPCCAPLIERDAPWQPSPPAPRRKRPAAPN
jgi:hypothetical protein